MSLSLINYELLFTCFVLCPLISCSEIRRICSNIIGPILRSSLRMKIGHYFDSEVTWQYRKVTGQIVLCGPTECDELMKWNENVQGNHHGQKSVYPIFEWNCSNGLDTLLKWGRCSKVLALTNERFSKAYALPRTTSFLLRTINVSGYPTFKVYLNHDKGRKAVKNNTTRYHYLVISQWHPIPRELCLSHQLKQKPLH